MSQTSGVDPTQETPGKKSSGIFSIDEADEEDLAWREAFKIFDRDGNGVISPKEFASVIRSIGSTKDTSERVQHELDFNEFATKLREHIQSPQLCQDLENAFSVFRVDSGDPERSCVTLETLQYALLNLGDPLTEEEVTAFLDDARSAEVSLENPGNSGDVFLECHRLAQKLANTMNRK